MKTRLLLPALLLAASATVQARPIVPAHPAAPSPVTAAVPARPALLPALTESQKIDALIASIEHLPGAVFIRNGSEYDASKAAAHLRMKRDYAGKRIKTAEQFIDKLATESSMTGKPYKIRFADGRTIDSAVYFHDQLKRIEAGHRAATAKG